MELWAISVHYSQSSQTVYKPPPSLSSSGAKAILLLITYSKLFVIYRILYVHFFFTFLITSLVDISSYNGKFVFPIPLEIDLYKFNSIYIIIILYKE